MAATKRPVPEPDFVGSFGSVQLLAPVDEVLATIAPFRLPVGVAVSGGADSAMLLVHAARIALQRDVELHAFHVHHGLQQVADTWREQVHELAQKLRLPCHSQRVAVDTSRGDGIESAARAARYQALAAMAQKAGVKHLLLAHHRDDQAETVLLRLLRGAGPHGMGAMAPRMERDGLIFLRPWLEVSRVDIDDAARAFYQATGWKSVVDPTNSEDRYTRSAVRERLAPQLNDRWPGWQAVLARHARQSREAVEILDEVAAEDFASLEPAEDRLSFSLAQWRKLSHARQALVLRYWLGMHGVRMPTEARLNDLMRQMRQLHALGHDRAMNVKHGDVTIRCTRGRVLLK